MTGSLQRNSARWVDEDGARPDSRMTINFVDYDDMDRLVL